MFRRSTRVPPRTVPLAGIETAEDFAERGAARVLPGVSPDEMRGIEEVAVRTGIGSIEESSNWADWRFFRMYSFSFSVPAPVLYISR